MKIYSLREYLQDLKIKGFDDVIINGKSLMIDSLLKPVIELN